MCYGEISGIDRDYHDYPESTIAQKVIFESSLWMLRILNHLKTISEPSHNHLNYLNISQLDLWCGLRLPVGLRSVYRCHVIYSTSKLISKIVFFFLKISKNHLKTISTISKPSQAVSTHLSFLTDDTWDLLQARKVLRGNNQCVLHPN